MKYTPTSPIKQIAYYVDEVNGKRATFGQPMIIEYQEGMENWDIPYFEGMQSVQMPVLTTSNEDGTKTNILTTSEEVTLRGIGDVKDELDLMTGEVVQSVGVLNGEETGWQQEVNTQAPTDSSLIAFSIDLFKSPNNNLLSSVLEKSSDVNKPYRWYDAFKRWLVITLPKSEVANLDEFKAWLKNNEVLYPLTEKSIKTVDLTCINEQGETVDFMPLEGTMNVETSSDTIQALLDMEVPVEAITQNLNSFASMEE